MKVQVLIPAHNEEANIQETISAAKKAARRFPPVDWSILVIDDGSTDNTCAAAAACQVKCQRLDRNRGKGGALRQCLAEIDAEIIVFLDADLKSSAEEVHKLISPLLAGEADVTVARFGPAIQPGGFGLVKALAAGGVRLFSGQHFRAALSGQRAFLRHVLQALPAIPDGYALEVGMLIDILAGGFRVCEVDVDMRHDETGRDLAGFVHRGRQFKDILAVLLCKLKERAGDV